MKFEKQDVGVWLKASEELPEDKRNPNGTPEIIVLRRFHPEHYIQYRTLTPNQIKDFFKAGVVDTDNWEWLKPIKDVYILTEDEMKKFATDFLLDTTGDMFLPNVEELAKQFINQ